MLLNMVILQAPLNMEGASPPGDDHISKSSTIAHQSEFAMLVAQIPILNPSNLEDLFNYGIFAWSFSGIQLMGFMKCITAIWIALHL